MKKIILLALVLASQVVFSYQAKVHYYIFTSKGHSTDGTITLEKGTTSISQMPDWFNWSCVCQKTEDGIVFSCKHGEVAIESKLFCDLPKQTEPRSIRLSRGDNFITFEVTCSGLNSKVPKSVRK